MSDRRTVPFNCVAVAKSGTADCLQNRSERFWGGFATQRGQAPSPQVVIGRGLRPIAQLLLQILNLRLKAVDGAGDLATERIELGGVGAAW